MQLHEFQEWVVNVNDNLVKAGLDLYGKGLA